MHHHHVFNLAGQVKKGEKYIYQKWFYQKPILPQYKDNVSNTKYFLKQFLPISYPRRYVCYLFSCVNAYRIGAISISIQNAIRFIVFPSKYGERITPTGYIAQFIGYLHACLKTLSEKTRKSYYYWC